MYHYKEGDEPVFVMKEWRNVPGFPCYYINIDTQEGRCIKKYKNGKIRELNQTVRNGRIYWCLTNNHKEYFWQAARWIALTFPELVQNEYFEGAEICHEDNNSMNNQPSNLKWGTHKENMNNYLTRKQHSEAMIGKKCHLGYKHSEEAKRKMSEAKKGKELSAEHKEKLKIALTNNPNSTPIDQFTLEGEFVEHYPSMGEAVRKTPSFNQALICACCKGKRKSHGGYVWKYSTAPETQSYKEQS